MKLASFSLALTAALSACGPDGCGSQIDPEEILVLCAREGDEITEDSHSLCRDSSMCNGIEWCDPTHPFRDERNCVATNPCDTTLITLTLSPNSIVPTCTEPTEESEARRRFGAPFRACRESECREDSCYDSQNGLVHRGDVLVPPQEDDGVLRHVDGFAYDIGCLRAVCTQALCTPETVCDDNRFCNGLEFCEPGIGCAAESLPCEDLPPRGETGEWQCNEDGDRCDWKCQDDDGDGFGQVACGGDDCDDTDADRFPGNPEVCDDGHDEDCDFRTVGDKDADGDGYIDAACTNVDDDGDVIEGLDCDDGDPAVHGAQPEVCNGVDDNCDGDIDEGVSVVVYVDEDGDGFGVGSPMSMCAGEAGFAPVLGDCDDTNPQIIPGSIVCDPLANQPGHYLLCGSDGAYTDGQCDPQTEVCIEQPGGHGICSQA